MKKDKRYKHVTLLFKEGQIKTFYEIFDLLPKTVLSKDMGIHNYRFNELMKNLLRFSLLEISIMATFFEIDFYVMIRLIDEQDKINKKIDKKNQKV